MVAQVSIVRQGHTIVSETRSHETLQWHEASKLSKIISTFDTRNLLVRHGPKSSTQTNVECQNYVR